MVLRPRPVLAAVCTIGGNVAENSGGAHCLKNGFTVNHVTGLTVVLPDGELVELGGKALDPDGYDLLGAFVGSEGTLGIATRITLRVLRRPESVTTMLAAFRSSDDAGSAVSGVIAAGFVPAAIEMMDRLTIEAAEAAYHPGYPDGAEAVLLVELDGIGSQSWRTSEPSSRSAATAAPSSIRIAKDEAERALLWKGRKGRSRRWAACRRLLRPGRGGAPTRLPDVPRRIADLSDGVRLRLGDGFHAGDGNLHPLVPYDAQKVKRGGRRSSPRRSCPVSRCRRLAHR